MATPTQRDRAHNATDDHWRKGAANITRSLTARTVDAAASVDRAEQSTGAWVTVRVWVSAESLPDCVCSASYVDPLCPSVHNSPMRSRS